MLDMLLASVLGPVLTGTEYSMRSRLTLGSTAAHRALIAEVAHWRTRRRYGLFGSEHE